MRLAFDVKETVFVQTRGTTDGFLDLRSLRESNAWLVCMETAEIDPRLHIRQP